ncbi:MAG: universal stress protein [Bacteroidetes bacterium]|nr:universal stress protein [Bacteroidota bacterium]
MRHFNRLLVALDFSELDETLLPFVAAWCNKFGSEKIYFVNVQRSLEVPEKYKSYLLEVDKPLDEKLKEDLQERIAQYFPGCKDCDYDIDVLEGNPRDQLAHWIKVKGIDLVFTGRKTEQHGRGILPQQLLRNSLCSIVFVPPGSVFSTKIVGTPVKLGSQEDIQLKLAMDWVDEGGTLVIEHFYSIPSSYNHMITTTGMLLEGMKESAEQELDELVEEYKTDDKQYEIKKVLKSIVEYNLSDAITKVSLEAKCDLVVMLSGSKSKIQSFLIGSETEAMVKRNTDLVLLILK